METQSIYQDIAKRTGGDIYIGVACTVSKTPANPLCKRLYWEKHRAGI